LIGRILSSRCSSEQSSTATGGRSRRRAPRPASGDYTPRRCRGRAGAGAGRRAPGDSLAVHE
jgi:hypothetical protein